MNEVAEHEVVALPGVEPYPEMHRVGVTAEAYHEVDDPAGRGWGADPQADPPQRYELRFCLGASTSRPVGHRARPLRSR